MCQGNNGEEYWGEILMGARMMRKGLFQGKKHWQNGRGKPY